MRISDWSSDVCSSDLARAMSCTRRICKGAKTVARGGARLLPVIIIPRREHHPPGERAGPERKGWKQAMAGTNPFETDLERGPAHKIGSESCRERVCTYV